jgi:cysteinyl-tRNA synthetase
MIYLIDGLIKKGYAYVSLNGVYFRIKSFPRYGMLSKKSVEELESGFRVEIDPSKENPLDFALWKFYSESPAWESPWGKGRPGWHIECSAMALKYFRSPFEIHGGGQDLIFPHHENEIAQSEAFTENQFSKIWVHCGMVTINSEKMSKSVGNIVPIKEALRRWGMNSLRIYSISVQYSKPLDYTDKLLTESMQRWRQIETCAYELKFASKFVTEINRYVAADKLTQAMSKIALVVFNNFMNIFGLKIIEATDSEKEQIEELILIRNKLRAEKKFQNSDVIRKKLMEQYSVELMDHKDGTVWKKVENPSKVNIL